MQVHSDQLSDVTRYIRNNGGLALEDKEPEYRNYMRLIGLFKQVDSSTRILEIGTGTGWFPLMCKARGIQCKGLEISPQLVEFAKEYGRRYGLEPDIELGNAEETDLGQAEWDVIVASSVFEHVEHWEVALKRIQRALKPGGIFYFSSTNKFSFTSGEYPLPLYGWMPDWLRYRFRMWRQGPDIMKLGIDFNQFRYPQLRRAFRAAGFRHIYDRIDMSTPDRHSGWKRTIIQLGKNSGMARSLILAFSDATIFVCVK